MAKDKQKTFQMLPVNHWWTLREKFRQAIPGVVTDNYLATALNIKPKSARGNVLPYLKDMGLIDDEGKTQELAKAWRDDEQYADVCRTIREALYPEELIAAVERPSEDREAVERWFANRTGAGSGAVKRMAAIYIVISEGDVTKRPEARAGKGRDATKKTPARKTEEKKPLPPGGPAVPPGLNINLEIHISADATPDQIDKIFESMARHVYKK